MRYRPPSPWRTKRSVSCSRAPKAGLPSSVRGVSMAGQTSANPVPIASLLLQPVDCSLLEGLPESSESAGKRNSVKDPEVRLMSAWRPGLDVLVGDVAAKARVDLLEEASHRLLGPLGQQLH